MARLGISSRKKTPQSGGRQGETPRRGGQGAEEGPAGYSAAVRASVTFWKTLVI